MPAAAAASASMRSTESRSVARGRSRSVRIPAAAVPRGEAGAVASSAAGVLALEGGATACTGADPQRGGSSTLTIVKKARSSIEDGSGNTFSKRNLFFFLQKHLSLNFFLFPCFSLSFHHPPPCPGTSPGPSRTANGTTSSSTRASVRFEEEKMIKRKAFFRQTTDHRRRARKTLTPPSLFLPQNPHQATSSRARPCQELSLAGRTTRR